MFFFVSVSIGVLIAISVDLPVKTQHIFSVMKISALSFIIIMGITNMAKGILLLSFSLLQW